MSEKKTETDIQELKDELTRLRSAADNALTPSMMIDRDLNVLSANRATIDLLTTHEATLRQKYPGFSVDGLIGSCIDIFHADPAYQRRILSDPTNLPHTADIEVGPLLFQINVTAMIDEEGNYIGNNLEWADVAETRQHEREVARLQSAIDGIQTNLMLADKDGNIVFLNPAVEKMFRRREAELRTRFPGFSVDAMIGTNYDVFHKNPAHQRALLSDLNSLPAQSEINLGDLWFRVNATAILDENGDWIGNAVEWNDMTEEKDAQKQIQDLIQNATAGQLDERVDASHYTGFMQIVGSGVNELMDAVVEPLRAAGATIEKLAEGDLRERMSGNFGGEFERLQSSINDSMENLAKMVSGIRESADTITSSSAELSEGNAALSQRTEEQASSLEETASSIEELTGTVQQNASNAGEANQLASGARDQAEKGGEVVGRAVSAMAEINNASKKIADIIGVIDEIAFQTNLLALNAAVEAARAGEQGRGFAVVATEVRNLAGRSATAAKEIKSLINDSVEKVQDGTRLVDESGKTLEEIVGSVKKVSDIIAEIAAASKEQSAGVEQINQAIADMDKVTQRNQAMVEQAASTAENLDSQANGLSQLVSFFTVTDATATGDSIRTVKTMPTRSATPGTPAKSPTSTPKPTPRATASADSDGEWSEF